MPTANSPAELLKENRLEDSIQAAIYNVKGSPADAGMRLELAELLCVASEWERADVHLQAASTQAPKSAVRCSVLRQLMRAAKARNECLLQGRPPELLEATDDLMSAQILLLMALRERSWAEAATLVDKVEFLAKRQPVVLPEIGSVDARDQDDIWSAVLELLTSTGKYYWVPVSRIETLSVYPPNTASELIWAMADISIAGGPNGRVYLPTIYPSFGEETTMSLQLGRETNWLEITEGLTLGQGLRTWWLGEEEKTIFELQDLEFLTSSETAN